jgi:peroxiredoxin
MIRLSNGEKFPNVEVPAVGGGQVSLPDDLAGHFGVVLITRGSWCPYCNAQLAAFQRASQTLDSLDIKVVSLSVDDEETSQSVVDKHHLGFPVGHSADVDKIAATLGASVSDEPGPNGRRHFQSTGFVLAPDGSIITSVYSSGAIGRLVPEDVIGLVRYLRSQS